MRRVLVPLDGSKLAESILPEAKRLAGPDGEIVLLCDVVSPLHSNGGTSPHDHVAHGIAAQLSEHVAQLRQEGFTARVKLTMEFDPSLAIDEIATQLGVDVVACATHGRGPLGRLLHGSVAWKAATRCRVPILLKHAREGEQEAPLPAYRRILVPLDGSAYAEKAVPLAIELANEWRATVVLVQIVSDRTPPPAPFYLVAYPVNDQVQAASRHLDAVAKRFPCHVARHVLVGPIIPKLIWAVKEYGVTDVVMASHGRMGLSRVILGSLADELVQHLDCPLIVIPARAIQATKEAAVQAEPATRTATPV